MVIVKYSAQIDSETKVDRFTQQMLEWGYRQRVDFPFDSRWVKPGYARAPDYDANWLKYGLCSSSAVISKDYKGLPERYKGVVVPLGEDCDPLWLAFGEYGVDRWVCQNLTRTYAAGYGRHVMAVEMLRCIKPLVDDLWVVDFTGLWESENLMAGDREFHKCLHEIKALSEMLANADMAHGRQAHVILPIDQQLALQSDKTSPGRTPTSFDRVPHWLRPTPGSFDRR